MLQDTATSTFSAIEKLGSRCGRRGEDTINCSNRHRYLTHCANAQGSTNPRDHLRQIASGKA
jgi:hypothetical protein